MKGFGDSNPSRTSPGSTAATIEERKTLNSGRIPDRENTGTSVKVQNKHTETTLSMVYHSHAVCLQTAFGPLPLTD